MADELMQTGIFEGMTWWNTNPAKSFLLAPYCSMAVGGGGGGGVDGFASVGDHLINHNRSSVAPRSTYNLFEDPPMADSSILQAMAFDASTWNHQDIMHGGSCDGDYVNNGIINPIMDAGEWNTSNTCGGGGSELNCSSSPPPAAVNSSGTEGSTVTCDGQVPVVNSFPVDPTSMFQNSLLNGDHEILIPSCEWISTIDHNQVLDSSFNQQQRQEQIFNHLRATLLGGSPASSSPPSPKPQSRKSTNSKVNKNDEGSDSGSVGSKNGGEPSIKRQRIETPSSLPTFKVRKEKLGDRITALQQLVSPFGKTDTASVLHEAIEYIKFLHDQVNALSTPYMKNGAPIQHHQQGKGEVGTNQDLSSRGLCLMPISSTFPVAHDSPADFWTPTFGATFR